MTRPDDADLGYIWDMLDAARTALELISGLSLEEYLDDVRTRLAIERCMEIIGEAARRVSECTQSDNPEVSWRPIIAQRHILAHEYGEIRHDLIWNVLKVHVPVLISQLEPLLPGDDE
jgi:uncharacterized protein with HEPN domain